MSWPRGFESHRPGDNPSRAVRADRVPARPRLPANPVQGSGLCRPLEVSGVVGRHSPAFPCIPRGFHHALRTVAGWMRRKRGGRMRAMRPSGPALPAPCPPAARSSFIAATRRLLRSGESQSLDRAAKVPRARHRAGRSPNTRGKVSSGRRPGSKTSNSDAINSFFTRSCLDQAKTFAKDSHGIAKGANTCRQRLNDGSFSRSWAGRLACRPPLRWPTSLSCPTSSSRNW